MNKIKRFFNALFNQDYVFSVVSKFMGVFIAVIYSIFFNRYLGAELKGESAIIQNYVSIISSIICLGMYQAYPFYKKKEKDVFYPFLNNMTSLYIIVFAVMATVGALVASFWDTNIGVALIIVPIQAYIRHINYIVTIDRPKTRNIASILINLTDLAIVVVLFAFTTASYEYVVIILAVQTLVNFIISYANLKASWKHFRFTLRLIPRYAKFGFLPMITLFLMTINYRIDVLMLEQFSTVSLAEIGIYSVGVALAEKVWLIPDAVKDILLSRLCKDKGKEEVAKVIRLNLSVTLIMVILVAVLARPFVLFVYGEEYLGADLITVIMLTGIIGMIFYKMVYAYNISLGKRTVNLVFLAVAAIANVIGNLILIPILGIYGAALTSVVSYTVCGICFLIYFKRGSGVSYREMLLIQKEDIAFIKGMFKKRSK